MIKNDKKIISLENSELLMDAGYLAIDPHVHSSYSYDVPDSIKTDPETIIKEQEQRGLLKIITDHDTMAAHNHLNRTDVIRGVEIKIRPKKMRLVNNDDVMHTLHVNVFGLTDEQFKDLESIATETKDLDLFIDYIRSEGLKYQYNHPFWNERKERLNWKAIPDITKNYFDVIEINAGRPKVLNDLALYLAREYGKGLTSSTDTHTGRPGRSMVLAKGKDFDEMWDNIKNREMYIVRNDMTALDMMNEVAHMIDNIFDGGRQRKKSYNLDTGITIIDNIASRAYKAGTEDMVGKIFYKGLSRFNAYFGTMIAEKLYISKGNDIGMEIAENLPRIMCADGNTIIRKYSYI